MSSEPKFRFCARCRAVAGDGSKEHNFVTHGKQYRKFCRENAWRMDIPRGVSASSVPRISHYCACKKYHSENQIEARGRVPTSCSSASFWTQPPEPPVTVGSKDPGLSSVSGFSVEPCAAIGGMEENQLQHEFDQVPYDLGSQWEAGGVRVSAANVDDAFLLGTTYATFTNDAIIQSTSNAVGASLSVQLEGMGIYNEDLQLLAEELENIAPVFPSGANEPFEQASVAAIDSKNEDSRPQNHTWGSDSYPVNSAMVETLPSQSSISEPQGSFSAQNGVISGGDYSQVEDNLPCCNSTPIPFQHLNYMHLRAGQSQQATAAWMGQFWEQVINDMNLYGVCVVDNLLGDARGAAVLREVQAMYSSGAFRDGELVKEQDGEISKTIRGDKITWVEGNEPYCRQIAVLIKLLDNIVMGANGRRNNGKLGDYKIKERSKAMVACYPGSGARYVKHVDNPNDDGRCVTAIYYLNKDWNTQVDGGLLRIFPEGYSHQVANIEPLFDRVIFFWSDRRNPHEVQPAFKTRYAITLWYFDSEAKERARNCGNTVDLPSGTSSFITK